MTAPPRPPLMYLADLRYRLYAGEGGSVHVRSMVAAFSEFIAVHDPACRMGMALLGFGTPGRRPRGPGKLLVAIALGISALEKALAFVRLRPALIYARHELSEVPALMLLKLLGARIALEVNAVVAEERQQGAGEFATRLTRWGERLAFRASDRIFCVSGYLRNRLIAAGVEPGAIRVTHNGIAPADFPEAALRPAADPVRVIGFNGTNKPWHGLGVLVSAFAALSPGRPDLKLLIVGPASPELEARIEALGLTARVEITGHLPHDAAIAQTRRFDIAVLPDCPPHNSPLKLFEYMGLGKPIIAAATPAVGEILTDGETAVLIAPGSQAALVEALERLIDDAPARDRLGRAARQDVLERFTWRRNALTVLSTCLPGEWGP